MGLYERGSIMQFEDNVIFLRAVMTRKKPYFGSSFESWLDEVGIRFEVTAAAIKSVIARQLAEEMKKKRITKKRMAELMKTSRAQLDRLLDPDNGATTIESLQRAASIVGRKLRLELAGCGSASPVGTHELYPHVPLPRRRWRGA